ncbi:hypothetical protein MASR2M50_06930 [Thauera sp.]
MVAAAPVSASEEQITTGVGRSVMIFFRKVSPSMRGISISSTITSGHWRCMWLIANSGSEAAAMTSMPLSRSSAWRTVWRTTAESSTIITLMRSLIGRARCGWGGGRAVRHG